MLYFKNLISTCLYCVCWEGKACWNWKCVARHAQNPTSWCKNACWNLNIAFWHATDFRKWVKQACQNRYMWFEHAMTLIKRKNKHVKFPKRNLNLLSFLHEKITRGNIIRNDPKTYPRVYFYLIYHQIIYAEKIVFKMPYLCRKILVQDGFFTGFFLVFRQ